MQYAPHVTTNVILYTELAVSSHPLARGAVGTPAPPRAVKKFRRNLQEKFVSAPPPRAHQVHP